MSVVKVKDDEIEVRCVCAKCGMKIVHKVYEQDGKTICDDYFEPIIEKNENENTEKRSIEPKDKSIEDTSRERVGGGASSEREREFDAEQSDNEYREREREFRERKKVIGIF